MTGLKVVTRFCLQEKKNVKLVIIIILHREHNEVAIRNFSQFDGPESDQASSKPPRLVHEILNGSS